MTPQEKALLQQEIQLRQQLLRILSTESGVSADLAKQMEGLLNASEDTVTQYELQLKKQRGWFKAEDDISKAKLDTAKRAFDTERKLRDATSTLVSQRDALQEKINKTLSDIQDSEQRNADLRAHLNEQLSEDKKQEIQDQIYRNNQKQKLWKQELDLQKKQISNNQLDEKQLSKAIKQAGDNRQEAESGYVNEALGTASARKLSSGIYSKLLSVFNAGLFAKAIDQTWTAVKTSMATGAGLAVKDVFTTASLGLNPKEYIELQAAHRRTILAAGGVAANFDILKAGQQKYFKNIGDLAETTKFTEEQLELLGTAGIRPTMESMDVLAGGFNKLQTLTGMTGDQFNKVMRDVLTDESTIARLRAARSEQERKMVLQGIQQRTLENAARGMSIEQIKETTKALNKMQGASPLDRIKQAARFRAFAGAMGVGGGAEAQSIMVKGNRASEQEKARLQEIMSNASNALGQASTGSLGGEIFATTLADKLDLKGTLEPFNTTLNNALVPLAGAVDSLPKIDDKMTDVVHWLQQIHSGFTNNPIMLAVGGALGVLLKGMRSGGSAKGAGWLSNIFGKGGPGAEISPGAAGQATKASKAFASIGKATKILGPLGIAAAGIYQGYDQYKQTGNAARGIGKGVGTAGGAWGGMAGGAALGTLVLPGIGTIIGGALGGLAGGWAGGEAGDKIGDMFSSKSMSSSTKSDDSDYYSTMTTSINAQLKKMDESNNYLKQMSDQLQDLSDQTQQQNQYLSSIVNLSDGQLAELKKKQQEKRITSSNRMDSAERKYGYVSQTTPGIRG